MRAWKGLHRGAGLSFLLFGHLQWRPLSFHFVSLHHFCGHGQWQPFYTHISFEFIASFLFGHRLWLLRFRFCHRITCVCTYLLRSGTASGDPFISFDFVAFFLWAPPLATQFSVLSCNTYIHSLLTTTSSERLLMCEVAYGWSQRTQVYIHMYIRGANALVHCSLITHIRQTGQNLF